MGCIAKNNEKKEQFEFEKGGFILTKSRQHFPGRVIGLIKGKVNDFRRKRYIRKYKLPIDGKTFDSDEDINEYKKHVKIEDQHYKIRIK